MTDSTKKALPIGVTGVLSPTPAYNWAHVDVDVAKMLQLLQACRSAGVTYGLGNKAPSLSSKPGKDFKRIDCSGFVRWVIYQAAGVKMPDGSVVQRDWIEEMGFKRSDTSACYLKDGAVRIAFLTPVDGGGTGHVLLVHNGVTVESHGGEGPSRRPWNAGGWMRKMHVYVLDPPPVPKATP